MSTTDHPSSHAADHGASTPAPGGTVVAFDALKRRRRLDQLTSARTHLATMAAQQRSHGLDDAQESFSLQLALESTLRDEFPEEYEQYFPTGSPPRRPASTRPGSSPPTAASAALSRPTPA